MAIQAVYQKRKTVGKQVFTSVFGATVIVSFLVLSYFGFTFLENILMSCIVLMCAFGFALVSTASVSSKAHSPQIAVATSNGYAAPTAFSSNSRLYGVKPKPTMTTELNTCKKCDQVMLAGIRTCPKCGWYTPR
jgi:ribosomal protein L32